MQQQRRGDAVRLVVAIVLLFLGVASFGLWRVLSGNEDQPYTSGATPPSSVLVHVGHNYSLAVPGGVSAMLAHGVPTANSSSGDLISLQCTWAAPGEASRTLAVAAESTSTKAVNTVGHFDAPIDGRIHVDCASWGAMFIPDSVDRSTDSAGWALLVSLVSLTVGAALALSQLRLRWEQNRALRTADEDDEVEGFVHITPVGWDDLEVGRGDRGDVPS